MLLEAGARLEGSRLGHATIGETMNTYSQMFPDDNGLGRGAIEALLTDALTEQQRNAADS